MMHIVCYLRQGSKVFETYWTTIRGVEAMDNSYRLLDLTVYGRQETWEDSPTGWPQRFKSKELIDGRPTAQWSRLKGGILTTWESAGALSPSVHNSDWTSALHDELLKTPRELRPSQLSRSDSDRCPLRVLAV
jgi:Bacterial protein of unknown function (DUF899)